MRDRPGDERSQSEVIGFVIVFSAVLAATALVALFGFTALEEVREGTVSDNGELAMQAVDANLEKLYYGSATSSTTQVKLNSASLTTGAATSIEVTASSPRGSFTDTWVFRPIVYQSEDADIIYENSLVVREQRQGAVAVTDSLFSLDGTSSVIPIIKTDPMKIQSVSGGTRHISARVGATDRRILTSGPGGQVGVTIVISDIRGHAKVWARTLNAELGMSPAPCSVTATGDEVVCNYNTERLVVSVVQIQYDLE